MPNAIYKYMWIISSLICKCNVIDTCDKKIKWITSYVNCKKINLMRTITQAKETNESIKLVYKSSNVDNNIISFCDKVAEGLKARERHPIV
jgi:hypothetical protein